MMGTLIIGIQIRELSYPLQVVEEEASILHNIKNPAMSKSFGTNIVVQGLWFEAIFPIFIDKIALTISCYRYSRFAFTAAGIISYGEANEDTYHWRRGLYRVASGRTLTSGRQ